MTCRWLPSAHSSRDLRQQAHALSASAGLLPGSGHRYHFLLLVPETLLCLHGHWHDAPWPLLPLSLPSRCGLGACDAAAQGKPRAPRDRGTRGHASRPGMGKLRIDSFYFFNASEIFKIYLCI